MQTFKHYSLGITRKYKKECVPQMYRCQHLRIAAWAYAQLQNNKECVSYTYRCKHFGIIVWAYTNYKMTKYVCLRSIEANI